MSEKLLKRLHVLDTLIAAKKTGTPKELAQRMRISERCVYKYIALLKKQGASISFCRKTNSYYYTKNGSFYFQFYNNYDVG